MDEPPSDSPTCGTCRYSDPRIGDDDDELLTRAAELSADVWRMLDELDEADDD